MTLYNKNNEPMFCKCGNPASGGMMGATAFQVWCFKCDPNLKDGTANFVYKPPVSTPQIPIDDWIQNLKESSKNVEYGTTQPVRFWTSKEIE